MNELTLFIFGFIIFSCYLFFLLRMINRQHKIQSKTDSNIIRISDSKKYDDSKAS